MKLGYMQVLRCAPYRKVLVADFIDRLGDSIDMIAFSWLTYQITQSASWSAIMFAVNQLPPILFMPFAGTFVENMNKKHVILFCDIMRGMCTALIVVLYKLDMLSIAWLLSITFLNNTFECFRIPASTALLPHILDKIQYEYGISLNASLKTMSELIGIALSGMILALIGVQGAILIDMCSFYLCALIYFTLHIKEQSIRKKTFSFSAYFKTLTEGIRYVMQFHLLRVLMCCSILCNVLLVPMNSYQAAFISGTLHLDAHAYSTFSFTFSLGIFIGTVLLPYLHTHISTRNLFLYSFYSISVYYIAMSIATFIQNPIIVIVYLCIVSFVCGIGIGIACNACSVMLIKIIDANYLARVSSLTQATSRAAIPLTSFLLSFLSFTWSIPHIFCVFAIFTFLVVTGMMFLKVLKQMQ